MRIFGQSTPTFEPGLEGELDSMLSHSHPPGDGGDPRVRGLPLPCGNGLEVEFRGPRAKSGLATRPRAARRRLVGQGLRDVIARGAFGSNIPVDGGRWYGIRPGSRSTASARGRLARQHHRRKLAEIRPPGQPLRLQARTGSIVGSPTAGASSELARAWRRHERADKVSARIDVDCFKQFDHAGHLGRRLAVAGAIHRRARRRRPDGTGARSSSPSGGASCGRGRRGGPRGRPGAGAGSTGGSSIGCSTTSPGPASPGFLLGRRALYEAKGGAIVRGVARARVRPDPRGRSRTAPEDDRCGMVDGPEAEGHRSSCIETGHHRRRVRPRPLPAAPTDPPPRSASWRLV